MKRKSIWNIVCVTMAALLLLLTACGGGGQTAQSQTTAQQQATTTAKAAETTTAAAKADETTTAKAAETTTAKAVEKAAETTAAKQADAAAASADVDMLNEPWRTPYPETLRITTINWEWSSPFLEGEDYNNNSWTRAAKNWFNIEVYTEWASADYETALNLAIASKSLPDFFLANNVQFKSLYEAGMIMDITEIHERLSSDTLRSFNDYDPLSLESAKFNGRIYGQPQLGFGTIDQLGYMWYRKDWMAEMNAPEPQTMDEVTELIRRINQTYGTKGIAADKDFNNTLFRISPAWHAYPLIWLNMPDGTIEFGGIQPEMKTALKQWADWYKEGLIHPEFSILDYNSIGQACANATVAAVPWWQWLGWAFGAMTADNNGGGDAYFEPYVMPTVDGKQQYFPLKFNNGGNIIVTNANCAHPEAVMKLIDMYVHITKDSYPDEMDIIEYETYRQLIHLPTFKVNDILGEYEQFDMIQEAMRTGDKSVITNVQCMGKYENIQDYLQRGDTSTGGLGGLGQSGGLRSAYTFSKVYVDNDWWVRDAMWGVAPDGLLRVGSTLEDLLKEGYTKIIMGIEPIDYFDKLVEEWYTAGGRDVTREVNDMYGK